MPRRRPIAGWSVAIIAASLAASTSGCDGAKSGRGGSGVPPAPPPAETASVAVILPAQGLAERDVWEAEARRDEARVHAMIEVRKPEPGDPPGRQAELIREAAASGVSALVIVADDPKAVAGAIAEVREQGLPVVLLDRDVALPGSATRPPLVGFEDERASAKALVDAAIADAAAAGFPPGGPAIIVLNDLGDNRARLRVKALRDVLEAEGVRVLPDLVVHSDRQEISSAIALAHVGAGAPSMIFAEDMNGLRGAAKFRNRLDHDRKRFVLAGFSADPMALELVNYNTAAAIVEIQVREPIHAALDAALALARGETVPLENRVGSLLRRSSGPEVAAPPTILEDVRMEKKMLETKRKEEQEEAEDIADQKPKTHPKPQ